jgi:hypothetical protein
MSPEPSYFNAHKIAAPDALAPRPLNVLHYRLKRQFEILGFLTYSDHQRMEMCWKPSLLPPDLFVTKNVDAGESLGEEHATWHQSC